MAHCGWMHTWASQFNPGDTKLLVSGVVNEVGGEVAVFSTGRGTTEQYEFLCRMVNDPYDFLGCWCSNEYVVTGTMIGDAENRFISSVWLCKTEKETEMAAEQQSEIMATNPHLLNPSFPAHLNMSNYLYLLFKFVNLAVSRCLALIFLDPSLKRTLLFSGHHILKIPAVTLKEPQGKSGCEWMVRWSPI